MCASIWSNPINKIKDYKSHFLIKFFINLGLVNLFPIPLLDGGQLVLLSFEAVKRSPLEEATVENFQKLGFVMVMSLVILALYNDLSRFWSSIVGSVIGAK
jgi:regulator of sigma E protease